jgi:hypothetical protein
MLVEERRQKQTRLQSNLASSTFRIFRDLQFRRNVASYRHHLSIRTAVFFRLHPKRLDGRRTASYIVSHMSSTPDSIVPQRRGRPGEHLSPTLQARLNPALYVIAGCYTCRLRKVRRVLYVSTWELCLDNDSNR